MITSHIENIIYKIWSSGSACFTKFENIMLFVIHIECTQSVSIQVHYLYISTKELNVRQTRKYISGYICIFIVYTPLPSWSIGATDIYSHEVITSYVTY